MSEIENTFGEHEYYYRKDPVPLTKFLKAMLWISLSVGVLSVVSDLFEMNLLSTGSISEAEAESNETRQEVVCLLYLGVFIVTGIVFLKWVYRANSNCHGFDAQGMKFTPGWSVGYYFVPIVNLYRPYQVMKEIWKVSKNPAHWQNEPGSPLLGWWWALWLISGFVGNATFHMQMKAETISNMKAATTASIISGIIDIPLCIVGVSLVSAIFARQEQLVRKYGSSPNFVPRI